MASFDYGSVATGAASGAAAGSVFPGIGTAVGAAVGVGLSLFGSYSKSQAAKQYQEAQQRKIQIEQQINEQRRQAMELDANRKQLEVVRNTQRVRSAGLQAATNQGAQFSSGYSGGQAQASAQGAWNLLGINQNLQIGRNVFALNNQLSQTEIDMGAAQTKESTASGYQSLGSSILSSMPAISALSKGGSGFGSQGGGYGNWGGGWGSNNYYAMTTV